MGTEAVSALDLAREHMARTGLDGYTLAVLMECGPGCWQDVRCTACGREKARIGRSSPLGAYECDSDCRGFMADPRPPHLWREDDETRTYTDLVYDLRWRRGEFREPDDGD